MFLLDKFEFLDERWNVGLIHLSGFLVFLFSSSLTVSFDKFLKLLRLHAESGVGGSSSLI